MLKKQISLAVLECHTEDSNTIQLFWELFVRAYEMENGLASTFDPHGWITDMAGANIEGMKRVFGVQAVQKIKGCEWHYKDGINKHAHRWSDCGATFKTLANALLEAVSPEGYETAKKEPENFISEDDSRKFLTTWLKWWDER